MSLGKYGVKIKKISAGSLFELNQGVRKYFSYQNAMFTNSLLLYYFLDNGLKITGKSTKDIICLDFDYGSRSFEEHIKRIDKQIKNEVSRNNPEGVRKLNAVREEAIQNEYLYNKVSANDIRKIYYNDGVTIDYKTFDKNGNIKKTESIHYNMLYRSTGKAKNGTCMFICDRLYNKAHDFLYMGLKLPKHKAPIVEMSAYCSLIASSIVDTININPKNILILKDVKSFFKTNVVSIELDNNGHCVAQDKKDYELKNTMFDGQGLIDSSIFPKNGNGYILLRHHMCKMACFNTNIQTFFKDYFKEKYDTATVIDMFGNKHYAKDIQLITTEESMKWLKFNVSYEYWCSKVNDNGNQFGIVKTAHKSKYGEVQRMSYQMVNCLDIDTMDNVVQTTTQYIQDLKMNDSVFLKYLEDNANFMNDYDVLAALVKQDSLFKRSEYFRERRYEIIRQYIKKIKIGKLIQFGDNLTLVGSPYAMLLHSVGESVEKDKTLQPENNAIQCYTEQFEHGECIAGFRSPHNSRNNILHLRNVKSDIMQKYFNLGKLCIAVNVNHTDIQDRANGCDFDSDMIYTTNQKDIVKHAEYCYHNYPTIVNNIPMEKKEYENTMDDYAYIDNNLAKSQTSIGESSNLAQLALTYCYNYNNKKYNDYVCILSVIAQVCIDSAKRRYNIDIDTEIKNIKNGLDIKINGYPLFWKLIKKGDGRRYEINSNLQCPMNHLYKLQVKSYRTNESTLPMALFYNTYPLEKSRKQSKKVEELIERYALYNYSDDDKFLLSRTDFDKLIEDIRRVYISKNYRGLMSWLINRAFMITNGMNNRQINSQISKNRVVLLKTLYTVNPTQFLDCFNRDELEKKQ